MSDPIYNDKNTVYVAPGYRHSEVPDPESNLYLLLLELYNWILSLPTDGSYPDYQKDLERYADRVNEQIVGDPEDNQVNGRRYAFNIEGVCSKILGITTPSQYVVENSSKRLAYLLRCIGEIFRVYQLGFSNSDCFLYQRDSVYEYISSVNQDKLLDLNTYKTFTDSVANGFAQSYLFLSRDFIDKSPDSESYFTERLNLYDLLFQIISEDLISTSCVFTPLVSLLVSIQNNRIFPNRENAIIAVGDCISILNFIQLTMYSLKLMRSTLLNQKEDTRDNSVYDLLKSLIEEFIKNNDMSLLPQIKDTISKVSSNVATLDSIGSKGSSISSSLKSSGNAMFDVKIESHMPLINSYNLMLQSISAELSKLKIEPDYTLLNGALDSLEELANHINNIIQNNDIANAIKEFVNDLNEILDAINAINGAINNTLCVIQQFLCIIGGWLNFMDTVIGPMLDKLNQLVDDLVNFWSDAVASVMSLVDLVNKAIRAIVYGQLEVKLLGKSQDAAVASGETYDSTWGVNYTDSVSAVILRALGQSGPTIQELTTQTQNKMNALKDAFVNAMSGANCPPIELPDLSLTLPKLNLILSLPRITQINFDLKC